MALLEGHLPMYLLPPHGAGKYCFYFFPFQCREAKPSFSWWTPAWGISCHCQPICGQSHVIVNPSSVTCRVWPAPKQLHVRCAQVHEPNDPFSRHFTCGFKTEDERDLNLLVFLPAHGMYKTGSSWTLNHTSSPWSAEAILIKHQIGVGIAIINHQFLMVLYHP